MIVKVLRRSHLQNAETPGLYGGFSAMAKPMYERISNGSASFVSRSSRRIISILMLLLSWGLSVNTHAETDDIYNMGGISFENTYISATDNIFETGVDITSLSLNGFGLEYIRGIGITDLPMYIEVGGKFTFTSNTRTQNQHSSSSYTYSTSMSRLSIPVSYAYRFQFKDDMSVTPYGGLDVRINLTGKTKQTHKYLYYKGSNKYSDLLQGEDSESYSWFNKDDVYDLSGVNDCSWRRFQLGWHIGGRFMYKRYFASLSYGSDLNSIFHYKRNILSSGIYADEHWFTGNFSLSLGYKF